MNIRRAGIFEEPFEYPIQIKTADTNNPEPLIIPEDDQAIVVIDLLAPGTFSSKKRAESNRDLSGGFFTNATTVCFEIDASASEKLKKLLEFNSNLLGVNLMDENVEFKFEHDPTELRKRKQDLLRAKFPYFRDKNACLKSLEDFLQNSPFGKNIQWFFILIVVIIYFSTNRFLL